MTPRHHLFRQRGEDDHSPVTYIELFFDLVFVFAITQLSHLLLEHLSIKGAVEALIIFLALWWVWIYTSWTTNWLDPDRGPVRLMLLALMMGGLVLSSAVPEAYDAAARQFAFAYVAMQLGRTLYMVWAWRGVRHESHLNFIRITIYFVISAPLWIAGAYSEGDTRIAFWAAALAVEYAGPFLFFRFPLLGHSVAGDWDISGAHMAERCALFIIISLGETVLIIGATFAELNQDMATWAAFLTSFVSSATMWWIYFDIGAKRGSERISHSDNAGLLARNAYTYLHMVIVAGIVVTAVADELMLAHPVGHAETSFVLIACGGPLIFLFGNQMFKWITSDLRLPPLSHFVGMLWMLSVAVAGYLFHWQPLAIGMAATGGLLITAIFEWGSYAGGWRRWTPWLGRLFDRVQDENA